MIGKVFISVNHHVRNFRKLSDQLDISALKIIELCKIANISEEKWTSELEVRARLLHFFTYKLIPNLEVLTERAETDKFQTINTGTGFFGALTKKHEKEFGSLPAWPENISRETKNDYLKFPLPRKSHLGSPLNYHQLYISICSAHIHRSNQKTIMNSS